MWDYMKVGRTRLTLREHQRVQRSRMVLDLIVSVSVMQLFVIAYYAY